MDSLHGWIGVTDDVLRTTDGGRTWLPSNPLYPIMGGVASISFVNLRLGYASLTFSGGKGTDQLYKTTDGGVIWRIVRSEIYVWPYGPVQFIDSLRGWVLAEDTSTYPSTRVLRTTNGGATWSSVVIPQTQSVEAMQFLDSLRGYIAGMDICNTTDGGMTWTKKTFDRFALPYLSSISFVDTLHGWASSGTEPAYVLHTTDGGKNWQRQDSILNFSAQKVIFTDNMNGWMFGGMFYDHDLSNAIYRTKNGGKDWILESFGLSSFLNGGYVMDSCRAWAVSFDGKVISLSASTSAVQRNLDAPKEISLTQNFPNPFNGGTNVEYTLKSSGRVTITLSDALGKIVAILADEEKPAGTYTLHLKPGYIASGGYWLTMKTQTSILTKKLLYLK